ncbi:hypothetical protein BV898_01068 [Hypsibius exemplaris]|uniref:Protein quiver n=1 Tax=Hypsibius exemplaris TaxID=2072580 RepID=A0A1W0XD37_HYPEX|nr:hypothetical protein BV898_01068 [Hypsibius exemplaris]
MPQVNTSAIVGGVVLVILLSTGAHALSCLMCNALMQGRWEACPSQGQYHSMTCRTTTHHCIKIDGNQTIVNQTLNGQREAKTVLGVQRNCGTPYNLELFSLVSPTAGCRKITVDGAALLARKNADGTVPQYFFQGEVCVCNSDNCNSS